MAASVVASVALPISNNFSFAPSMDAYGKLSEYGKLGAWSPLSLFAASEVGAWYDPSDLTTMFQDSAGTTPVTADGQPVGKILDKSGRGNHASQATAAARPLYKTDGTHHWLQFDGVDDSLSTAAINFTSTDKMSVFSGVYKASDAVNNRNVVELSASVEMYTGSFYLHAPQGISFGRYFGVASRGSLGPSYAFSTSAGGDAPVKKVLSMLAGISNDTLYLRINGSVDTQSSTDQGVGNYDTHPLYIGSRGDIERYFVGNIYSLIVRGAPSTADEITATETWVNNKTGAF